MPALIRGPNARAALAALGHRPTLVLVGDAGGEPETTDIEALLLGGLVPLLEASCAAVVDGGTDAGIMRAIGRARARAAARFPLIGVAPRGCVALGAGHEMNAAATAAMARPEPNHDYLWLVPGRTWGDESRHLVELGAWLGQAHARAMLVVGGGEVTRPRWMTPRLCA